MAQSRGISFWTNLTPTYHIPLIGACGKYVWFGMQGCHTKKHLEIILHYCKMNFSRVDNFLYC